MKGADKFNALTEEEKLQAIYRHALGWIQTSIFDYIKIQNIQAESLPDFSEDIEYLKGMADYICAKTGVDPNLIYPHITTIHSSPE